MCLGVFFGQCKYEHFWRNNGEESHLCCNYEIVNVCMYFITMGATQTVTRKIVVVWDFFLVFCQFFLEFLYVGHIYSAHVLSEQNIFAHWCRLWPVHVPCIVLT